MARHGRSFPVRAKLPKLIVATPNSISVSATDSITISENAVRLFSRYVVLSDSVVISENIIRLFSGYVVLSDSVTSNDVLSTIGTFVRATSESMLTGESGARLFSGVRTTTDLILFDFSVSASTTYFRTSMNSVLATEDLVFTSSIIRSATDFSAASELIIRIFLGIRLTDDLVTTSDTNSVQSTFVCTTIDSLVLGDVLVDIKAIPRSIVDTIATSDSVVRSFNGHRITTETVVSVGSVFASKSGISTSNYALFFGIGV